MTTTSSAATTFSLSLLPHHRESFKPSSRGHNSERILYAAELFAPQHNQVGTTSAEPLAIELQGHIWGGAAALGGGPSSKADPSGEARSSALASLQEKRPANPSAPSFHHWPQSRQMLMGRALVKILNAARALAAHFLLISCHPHQIHSSRVIGCCLFDTIWLLQELQGVHQQQQQYRHRQDQERFSDSNAMLLLRYALSCRSPTLFSTCIL